MKENSGKEVQIEPSAAQIEKEQQITEKSIGDNVREEEEEKEYHHETLQSRKQQERFKTRLMTLNVYSIRNKRTAAEQFLRDNNVHIAVITETHVQEEGEIEPKLKDYTLVNTRHRKKGYAKGGVAIYVYITVPCAKEYSKIVECAFSII